MVPFVAGVGAASTHLGAFHNALKSAGIDKYNLVPVSSILSKDWGEVQYVASYDAPIGSIVPVICSKREFRPMDGAAIIVGLGEVEKPDHRIAFEVNIAVPVVQDMSLLTWYVKEAFQKHAQPFGELSHYYWIYMNTMLKTFLVGKDDNYFLKEAVLTAPDDSWVAFTAFVIPGDVR